MCNFDLLEGQCKPFEASQIVRTEGLFCHIGLLFGISGLDNNLRSFLVLFQELIFQSPLSILFQGKYVEMDYTEVAKYVSENFVSHECGVGLGNAFFSTSYLNQVLSIYVSCDQDNWKEVIKFLAQVIFCTKFTRDRVKTIAKTLINTISDYKRDGDEMHHAVLTRVIWPENKPGRLGNNEHHISIFNQEAFLESVLKLCEVFFLEIVRNWFF
jgi:Zn-dependent M16 (insulinase) family peptidase